MYKKFINMYKCKTNGSLLISFVLYQFWDWIFVDLWTISHSVDGFIAFFECFQLKFIHVALLTQCRSTVLVEVWVFRPSFPCFRWISKRWQPQRYKESCVGNRDIPCWIGILLLSSWPSSILCLWAQCSCLWWDWGIKGLWRPRLD